MWNSSFTACVVSLCISVQALGQACTEGFWTPRASPSLPAGLMGGMMAYDEARQEMIYFGGINYFLPQTHPATTWRWNGTTWSVASSNGPGGRRDQGMAYDSHRQKIVMFGGYSDCPTGCNCVLGCNYEFHDTWEWDGTQWTQIVTATVPYSAGGSMAYDPVRQVCVFWGHGTSASPMHTWEYNGSDWTLRNTTEDIVRFGNLAFDHARNKVIRFGGLQGCESSKMYEWDGLNWTDITVPYRPWGRITRIVSDPYRKRIVAFGGQHTCDGIYDLGDTWEWDGNSWELASPGGPAPRSYHAVGFDTMRRVMVTYGGYNGNTDTILNDTWEWTPPVLACGGDVTCDDQVNVTDLLAVIGAWGACPAQPVGCPADVAPFNGDSTVNVSDLLMIISRWGPCS